MAIKNENGEFRRSRGDPQLRTRFTVEVRHHENVVPRISGQVPLRIGFLQFFRLRIQPMADHGRDHASKRRENILLKIYQRDQPEFRIAVILSRNAIPDRLGLLFILSRRDGDNRDVAIRGRELPPINVRKSQRISIPNVHLDGLKAGRHGPGNEEKILPDARDRA